MIASYVHMYGENIQCVCIVQNLPYIMIIYGKFTLGYSPKVGNTCMLVDQLYICSPMLVVSDREIDTT